MANNNMSLDALKAHLFEALEGVKNLNDPKASKNEKTSIEQAKAISDLSSKIIDIYKTQLNAVETFVKIDNVKIAGEIMQDLGVMNNEEVKQLSR